jgi:IS5 family transposase
VLDKLQTNYKHARLAYLLLVKEAKNKGKMVRDTLAVILNHLHKELRKLMDLFARNDSYYDSLYLYEKCTLTAIIKMCHQQEEIYRSKVHTFANRILSIFQPHIQAIVHGKAKAKTGFGAKIGASIVEGYTFIDHHSWDAYNES